MKFITSSAAVLLFALGTAFAGPALAESVGATGDANLPAPQRERIGHHKEQFDAERFQKADLDGDGVLSRDELAEDAEAARIERRANGLDQIMALRDFNNDGGLSLEEMTADLRLARMFNALDADNDGQISREEFNKAPQDRHGRHRPRHGQDGGANR